MIHWCFGGARIFPDRRTPPVKERTSRCLSVGSKTLLCCALSVQGQSTFCFPPRASVPSAEGERGRQSPLIAIFAFASVSTLMVDVVGPHCGRGWRFVGTAWNSISGCHVVHMFELKHMLEALINRKKTEPLRGWWVTSMGMLPCIRTR